MLEAIRSRRVARNASGRLRGTNKLGSKVLVRKTLENKLFYFG